MANKYIAFISYRHAELDSAIAKALHSLIEQYRIPRGIRKDGENRLGVVFRDQEELHAASDLSSEIQNALNSTEYLIVICSKNSVESPWVTREVDHFLQHHDRSQVLTVLASGEPMEVFPAQLTCTPEGEPIEPLAVDIRADSIAASRKKLRRELPRLISAILKCPYDALVMREHRRKTRRITAIAAGAMAVLLGFTSMVLLKNQQIELANDQLEVKNTQLNEANVALEEQKAAVQLRESQLLVQSALEDLDNADYYSAMQKAVDALPADASDNRPYYAPAEQVLMEAMGVFRVTEPDAELNTIQFAHLANIKEFQISPDGTRLVSTDTFGTVTCFDVDTRQQLWYQYTAPDDSLSGMTNLHLFLTGDSSAVIRSTKNLLTAYDLQTGQVLWEEASLRFVNDYTFYHAQRDVLITISSTSTEDFTFEYHLIEIDAKTGEILHKLHLDTTPSFSEYIFASPGTTSRVPTGGAFSSDGTRFAGAYLDDTNVLHCFYADLTEGALEIFYTHPEPSMYLSEVCGILMPEPDKLILGIYNTTYEEEIVLMALDMPTGQVLWQTMLESSNIPFASYSVAPHMLFIQSNLLVGYCDRFTLIEPQTGTVLSEKIINGLITSLTLLNEYNFAFSVDAGTYAIGWTGTDNAVTLTTDVSIQTYADVDAHSMLQVWGGGIVQLHTDSEGLLLAIGNHVSPGYIALVPSQEKNVIQVIRTAEPLSLVEYTPVDLFRKNMNAASDCAAVSVGPHLILGPFYEAGNYSSYTYVVLDPATGKVTDTFTPDGYYDSGELFWLPDSMTPLKSTYANGIALFNRDGTKTVLFDPEAEQKAFSAEDGLWSSYSLFRSTSAYLSDHRTLLSAATTPRQLRLWRNGVSETQADLPESLTIAPGESSGYNRLLKAGANGWILTSLHLSEAPIPLRSIALYDTNRQIWVFPESDDTIPHAKAVAFANSAEVMAYVDSDGSIQLLDLNTGKITAHFGTQISAESILHMEFFLEDSCLAIKTSGGYLQLYDLSTGQRLYYTQMNDAYSEYLQIFEDSDNQRLYIHGGNRSGICLELGSWSWLGDADNLLCYHPGTGMVYQANRVSGKAPVSCAEIPNTLDLVKLARKALAKK